MKKMFRNLMLVAVAAMAFAACEKEGVQESVRPQEVAMTIIADMDETRTWIDEANSKVQWSEGDKIKVIENGAAYRTSSEATIANGKAKFSVSFNADQTSTSFTYNAIYPADRVVEDDADKMNTAKVKVVVPDAQNPTATSFDPTADILVSKQITTNAQPTELSMQFKRLVALGKMTLSNLPASSTISKVTFSVDATDEEGNGLTIAGRNYVDTTTGDVVDYNYYGGTNTITLNYLTPVASTTPNYFTCNPFELASGDKFTVEVICSDATYTREVTLSKSLVLSEGNLSKFTVDMTNATKKANFVFPDGDYAAIAVDDNKYYALSSAANGTRLNAVEVTYNGGASFTTTDATLKWTVTKSDDGYTFKGSNNQYVAWSGSGNNAKTQDDVYYLDITEDADNAGRYFVTVKADATRKLQMNPDYGYFAFYTSAQSGSLYLVPVTVNDDGGNEGGEEGGVVKATIADFLAAAEDSTIYELTGQITSVNNTTYGNFYIKDNTGEVYIYGLCSPTGEQKYWAESGVKVGDTITIQTVRTSHNGSPQGKNAIYVSHVPGEAPEITVVEATVDEFLKAEESTTVLYELTGKIANVVADKTYYGNFDLVDETGSVYIYGLVDADNQFGIFEAKGLKEGDTITLRTVRSSHNGSPQGKNALYVSHVAGEGGETPVDPEPEPTGDIKYTKITSSNDLTDGTYIIVYEDGTNAYVFSGVDAANGYTAATISNNSITSDSAFAGEVTIATMNGGYSLSVSKGYMSGTSGNNKLNFGTTASANTITFESDGSATITSNTSVFRFNSSKDNLRFRYFKAATYTGQKAVCLYKKD